MFAFYSANFPGWLTTSISFSFSLFFFFPFFQFFEEISSPVNSSLFQVKHFHISKSLIHSFIHSPIHSFIELFLHFIPIMNGSFLLQSNWNCQNRQSSSQLAASTYRKHESVFQKTKDEVCWADLGLKIIKENNSNIKLGKPQSATHPSEFRNSNQQSNSPTKEMINLSLALNMALKLSRIISGVCGSIFCVFVWGGRREFF